jgi:hypothetical protein
MTLAEQIEQLVGRGFSEERAETIVLMREAAIIIFDTFPETLVLVGGANLVLFQESVRHSADLDFFPVSGEMPNVAEEEFTLRHGRIRSERARPNPITRNDILCKLKTRFSDSWHICRIQANPQKT